MKSTPRILVLDDDSVTRRMIEGTLESEGYQVQGFGTSVHALAAAAREPFDLFLLDVMLPDGDGMACCEQLRQKTSRPIIMITARGEVEDVVAGLERGADDYVVKPIRMPELVARVKRQLRRADESADGRSATTRVGYLTIDRAVRDAFMSGRRLHLTAREFEILDYLATRGGRAVARTAIMSDIWGDAELSEKILAVYIRRLRAKIEANPDEPKYLHTVRGFGYRLGLDA